MKLRNFTKILIGFFAIVSLLCLLELSLSSMDTTKQLGITNMNEMFRSGVFTKDRVLFWKFSPGKIYTNPSTHYKGVLRINSIGFREREISKYKDTKTYRVFCLGGSNTCGEGVFENERFSNVVEKKLNELLRPLTFEVYNFGMPGYSTLQMLRLLENELVYFNPDLIIVNPEQADGLELSDLAPFKDSQVRILPPLIFNLTSLLEDKSAIYRLTKRNLLKNSWRRENKGAANRNKGLVRVTPEEHKENLLKMSEIAQNNGFKIIFLSSLGIRDGNVVNVYKDYVGQPGIDITFLFKDGLKNGLFQDQGHINAKGHYLIAESLKEYIKNNY